VVRLSSPGERNGNLSWVESRREERTFFEQDWWKTKVKEQGRLGTENLSVALSGQLTRMIRKRCKSLRIILKDSLPKLRAGIELLLDETNRRLRELPVPPSDNPEREIRKLCKSYVADLERYTMSRNL
jgi:hypothetical protein